MRMFLKKYKFYAITSIFLLLICGFFLNEKLNKQFDPNFRLGVIFTSSVWDRSYIRFYDDDLKLVYEERINIGGAGSYYNTKVYKDKLYVPMQGTDHVSHPYMLEYDLNMGKYNILDVKQFFVRNFDLDDDYIFVVNATPGANITKVDRKSGESDTISFEKLIPSNLTVYNNQLYAFLGYSYPPISKLYKIDPSNMKVLDEIDLTDKAVYHENTICINDEMYFCNNCNCKYIDEENYNFVPCNTLTKFNTKTNELTDIKLEHDYPFQILHHKDKLIISHCEAGHIGDGVTVYNLKDGTQKYITLENKVRRMNIYKNKIFVASQTGIDVYDADTFELINSLELDWLNKFGAKFGDTSFFIKP